MMFRMVGIVATFGVICYLFYAFLSSNNHIKKAINANPTVQEQQKALKDATGVDATNDKALKDYTKQQLNQLQEYQNSAPSLPQ